MGITAEAPRGGVVEEIGGVTYTFLLRLGEIERFEDRHRGIFDVWDGFFNRGKQPNSREVRDLVALALVGGGKKDREADAILEKATPADLLRLKQIAQAALGVAFMPEIGDEQEKKSEQVAETEATASTSAGS